MSVITKGYNKYDDGGMVVVLWQTTPPMGPYRLGRLFPIEALDLGTLQARDVHSLVLLLVALLLHVRHLRENMSTDWLMMISIYR